MWTHTWTYRDIYVLTIRGDSIRITTMSFSAKCAEKIGIMDAHMDVQTMALKMRGDNTVITTQSPDIK